jgi:hypothetical protein
MMKKILSLLSLLVFIYSQNVFAHGGSHAPVSEARVIEITTITVNQFVHFDAGLGFGKLDKSWNDISADEKRIHKKGNGYYIVSATNKKAGKTLYILMSLAGEIYDANFSGVFEGLTQPKES